MKSLKHIAHFSSFLPRRCGIAVYTFALIRILEDHFPTIKNSVVAIDSEPKGHRYTSFVKFHFWDKDKKGYQKAASFINQLDCQIVDIQHEFGLFGAPVNPATLGQNDGENFLLFIENLKKPAVTTLHTVFKNPPAHHREVVKKICQASQKVVVIAHVAKKILVQQYKISPRKIVVIPHGAPNVPRYRTAFFKEMFGFEKKNIIISCFGLISPRKGLEYLIEAMPEVLKNYPQAILLIIGKKHPLSSPSYYEGLVSLVNKLHLKKNVKFVNRFLNYYNLLNYLMATDIFVTPYLVMEQISSGALTYAMACGRACIATPFEYAKEMLGEKESGRKRRGILVPPKDSLALARAINHLIKHPKLRHRMANLAYKYVRNQIWSKTASSYIRLFKEILNQGH